MSTLRARFDGKVFVPEKPVQLPVGEVVEIRCPDNSPFPRGTAAAILHAMKTLPKVSSEDVAEMERLINEGTTKATFEGVFDDCNESTGEDDRER